MERQSNKGNKTEQKEDRVTKEQKANRSLQPLTALRQ